MKAIERCRRELAWLSCVELSPNRLLFKGLVKEPKVAKRAVAFTYEKFRPSHIELAILPNLYVSRLLASMADHHSSREMSYTEVLEARVPEIQYLATHPKPNDVATTLGVHGKITLSELRKL
jgi:hypothetical protein